MTETPQKQSMEQVVLAAIRDKHVKMRPKWHFVLKTVLAVLGGLILLFTLIYLGSFIIFVLRQSGVLFIPSFGFHGIIVFLLSIPWLLIILLCVFAIILEILVRRYAFAYQRPLVFSAFGIVILLVVGGYIVGSTPLHGHLSSFAEKGKLPLAGHMYKEYGHKPFKNIHPGVVINTTSEGFLLQNPRQEILVIIITTSTRLPNNQNIVGGEMVVVFGDREPNNIVHAFGVKPVK